MCASNSANVHEAHGVGRARSVGRDLPDDDDAGSDGAGVKILNRHDAIVAGVGDQLVRTNSAVQFVSQVVP